VCGCVSVCCRLLYTCGCVCVVCIIFTTHSPYHTLYTILYTTHYTTHYTILHYTLHTLQVSFVEGRREGHHSDTTVQAFLFLRDNFVEKFKNVEHDFKL
jgi:hypothetical protein